MASLLFDSFWYDALTGAIDCDTDTFYAMLTTSSYVPNKGTDLKRSAVTNEITGTGYTAGGAASTVTVTKDTTNHRIVVALGAVSWATATIAARQCVYYKRRGGASSADELVGVSDFVADKSVTASTFLVPASVITLQN